MNTAMNTDLLNATVIERHDLYDELAIIKVRPDSGAVPDYLPGQFITLGMPADPTPHLTDAAQRPPGKPKLVRRAYSIASSPKVKDHMEFYIVLVEEGKLTPRLWQVEEGGRVWINKKAQGEFTMEDVPPGKDLVMVSTGTGIAPFISMLRTYREEGRWRRFVMIHGVRFAYDLGYREEMERIAAEDPTVTYIPMCTREPEDSAWAGCRGRIQSILLSPEVYEKRVGAPLTPEDCHVFLCGNPDMILSVQGHLEGRGFVTQTKKTPGNLHFERYW